MRDQILAEIRRITAKQGKPPGQVAFARETGIANHTWCGKFWARWGDALLEAGYAPNEWTPRLETDQILLKIVDACRHYGKIPTKPEFGLLRKTNPQLPSYTTVIQHFGSRQGIVEALRKKAESEAFSDIFVMLPNVRPDPAEVPINGSKALEGFVYLIKSGNYYKVGRSDDIERRVKQIRVALPDKAELVHSIKTDDPPGIEAYWHSRFKDKRANGEWFKLSSLDVAAFRKRKYQ